jgi:hypothetical protein
MSSKKFFYALFFAMLFILASPVQAAVAVIDSLAGTLRDDKRPGVLLKIGDSLDVGATLVTDTKSHALLRFRDGQLIVLNESTTFRITEYNFSTDNAAIGNAIFLLVKGGLRAISGMLAKRNQNSFKIITPTATIGIRGTDFMAVTGSLFVNVGEGVVTTSTTAGTTSFAAGQIGYVSAVGVMPLAITAAQLPAAVAATFANLTSVPLVTSGITIRNPAGYGGSGTATSGGAVSAGSSVGSGVAAGGVSSGAIAGAAVTSGAISSTAMMIGGIVAGAAAATVGKSSTTTNH